MKLKIIKKEIEESNLDPETKKVIIESLEKYKRNHLFNNYVKYLSIGKELLNHFDID